MSDNESRIITDEDWKQQAQREKERLSEEAQPSAAGSDGGATSGATGGMPPVSFLTHIESIAVQIFFCLGVIKDPSQPEIPVNLDLAKHYIDTLAVLQEKTEGNLTEEEQQALSRRLHEVRMQYVAVAQAV